MAKNKQEVNLKGDGKRTFRKLGRCEYRHDFSPEEFKDAAERLTRFMREVELKEESIKADAAAAKADLRQLRSKVNEQAATLRNGYETRTAEAIIIMDRKDGVKRSYFNAPGKPEHEQLITEAPMTEDELSQLPLSDEDGATAMVDPLSPPTETSASTAAKN